MNITCIGGGPAGLYFAISMKLRDPRHRVRVIERNKPYDTFGWGVVFSDDTLGNLLENDPQSAEEIIDTFAHWDDIDVHYRGTCIRSSGHGFSGLGRKRLLGILQSRARELGVELDFERQVQSLDPYRDEDLIIAADGVNSTIRSAYRRHFKPHVALGKNKYIWLGTHKVFNAFTFAFENLPEGWLWAHAYRFSKDTSTFIVECQAETWERLGFGQMSPQKGVALCERIFEKYLDGNELINNAKHLRSPWLNFPLVKCEEWSHENIVLMGDAAHSAHFSVGSGTKLAMEDAIELSRCLSKRQRVDDALREYEESRSIAVLRLQNAARNSTQWFETMPRYAKFEPMQFTYSLLTRSQRVSHDNLRLRDPKWLGEMERWFAARAGKRVRAGSIPPMFVPIRLRGLDLVNRIVVSPMAMYSATEGTPNDFHLVHWGARAQGGAGLLFTEMTCVTPQGRISPGCCGMYKEEHVKAWRRIVNFVHAHGVTKIGLQLGHSGPKGSTRLGWEGSDEPLEEGNWPVIGPSAIPWRADHQVPKAMTREDMAEVKTAFVDAVVMARQCGFDILELHCAHGYLLSAFITPLLNARTDEYGGSLENRLRFPLEVFSAMRMEWPQEKPMSVRISATDWVGPRGMSGDEAVHVASAFKAAGADIIDVSAGQTSPDARPVYGRMFQTPFADQIRNEVDIPVMAVGNIYETDHVNSILASGRADLCCLARPHLTEPYWTLHAAAEQGYSDAEWPVQYLPGRDQLLRLTERRKQAAQNAAPAVLRRDVIADRRTERAERCRGDHEYGPVE